MRSSGTSSNSPTVPMCGSAPSSGKNRPMPLVEICRRGIRKLESLTRHLNTPNPSATDESKKVNKLFKEFRKELEAILISSNKTILNHTSLSKDSPTPVELEHVHVLNFLKAFDLYVKFFQGNDVIKVDKEEWSSSTKCIEEYMTTCHKILEGDVTF